MPSAYIFDFAREHERGRRLPAATIREMRASFQAPLYRAATGTGAAGNLRWGSPVEVLERGSHRSRVRSDGLEGFVSNDVLVDVAYVKRGRGKRAHVAKLFRGEEGSEALTELLWGDRVYVLSRGSERTRVRARGRLGWVKSAALGEEPLLELYFVDVGQGDGVLIRTPDGRHLMLDGGFRRASQPTGKSAADFVDWKFFVDYGVNEVHLDVMISSHCDADHYGGLWDLLSEEEESRAELDTTASTVRRFYHAGVSWWKPTREEKAAHGLSDKTSRWLGPPQGGLLTRLIEGKEEIKAAVKAKANPALQGQWAEFLASAADRAEVIERLGVEEGSEEIHLPGYGPDDPVTLRILAPVIQRKGELRGVTDYEDDSKNTNGHSVLLALRFQKVRVLLTGDLNKKSMRTLLEAYEGREDVFACDVAKACHHGSDDVSYTFLSHLKASATIISSGDAEGHAHPRPAIVAASALTGNVQVDARADELVTPLVYSTEIERSVRLGRVTRIAVQKYPHEGQELELALYAVGGNVLEEEFRQDAAAKEAVVGRMHYRETAAGAVNPASGNRDLRGCYVVAGVIYGLVNVRTDGNEILCATLSEADNEWNYKTFKTRF